MMLRARWAALLAASALVGCGTLKAPGNGNDDAGTGGGPDAAATTCSKPADCAAPTPLCAPSGVCVACLGPADCAAPEAICDADTSTCRGCVDHGDCSSGACDLTTGLCVAATDIVYVNGTTGMNGLLCGTVDKPCLTITNGLNKVLANRRTVVVAAGTYAENLTLNKDVALIGDDSVLQPPSTVASGISIPTGRKIVIDRFKIHRAQGEGLTCLESDLTLRRVVIENSAGAGLDSAACALTILESTFTGNDVGILAFNSGTVFSGRLDLERSLVANNTNEGIRAGVGQVTVVNNVIANNSGVDLYHGAINLGSGSNPTGMIAYNTIVGNGINNLGEGGIIECGGPSIHVSSNIVWGNPLGQAGTDYTFSNCCLPNSGMCQGPVQVEHNLSDRVLGGSNVMADPTFADLANGDFHLTPGSPGIDQGDPLYGAAVDKDGVKRPSAAGYDIGAFETHL